MRMSRLCGRFCGGFRLSDFGHPYLTGKNGGDDETRTRDLCRGRWLIIRWPTQCQWVSRAVVGNRWPYWAGRGSFCATICSTSISNSKDPEGSRMNKLARKQGGVPRLGDLDRDAPLPGVVITESLNHRITKEPNPYSISCRNLVQQTTSPPVVISCDLSTTIIPVILSADEERPRLEI
jgi:hypothetical protein